MKREQEGEKIRRHLARNRTLDYPQSRSIDHTQTVMMCLPKIRMILQIGEAVASVKPAVAILDLDVISVPRKKAAKKKRKK